MLMFSNDNKKLDVVICMIVDHILLRKPTKVFIGNVPHSATSEDLRAIFEHTGLDIHECDKVS